MYWLINASIFRPSICYNFSMVNTGLLNTHYLGSIPIYAVIERFYSDSEFC